MYEFKKLSEVDLLNTVPEGATVLAEVDGVIRRVPSNGLGGAESTVVEILPEQTVAFMDSGIGKYMGCFSWTFEDGETYTIVYDGVEYECVAHVSWVGNASLADPAEEDTGEPFAMGMQDGILALLIASTATENTVVEVYHNGTLLQRFTRWFADGDAWITSPIAFTPELGQTYTIVWDGTEYQCQVEQIEDGLYCFGNAAIMNESRPNTGEPFVLAGEGSETECVIMMAGTEDPAASHTIRIYQGSGGVSWEDIQDKPFYDNSFRLTATAEDVDLDTIAAFVSADGAYRPNFAHAYDQTVTAEQLIGATMAVEYDGMVMDSVILTAENILYADERALMVSLGGSTATVFFETGAMSFSADGLTFEGNVPKTGIYLMTNGGTTIFDSFDEGTVLALSKEDVKQIESKFVPDDCKLPTVTEADNGKVLMVVDGKWAVVDLPTT